MRARPFIAANEQPRPFSEIASERDASDPVKRAIAAARDRIAALESAAAGETDPDQRKALLCDAEAIRCAISESPRMRR